MARRTSKEQLIVDSVTVVNELQTPVSFYLVTQPQSSPAPAYTARAAWTARSRADTAMVRRRAADTLPSARGGRMLSTGVLELAARTPFEDPPGEDRAVNDHQDHGR